MADAEVAAALWSRIRRDVATRFGAHEPGHDLLVKVQSAPKAKVAGVVEQFLAKARAAGV